MRSLGSQVPSGRIFRGFVERNPKLINEDLLYQLWALTTDQQCRLRRTQACAGGENIGYQLLRGVVRPLIDDPPLGPEGTALLRVGRSREQRDLNTLFGRRQRRGTSCEAAADDEDRK